MRLDELLEAERAAAHEREHELRRVKQREYAEQQLRVEAEDRLSHVSAVGVQLERESRAEIEQLSARLSASEAEARELAGRLEDLQRQLAEAEQQAGAERAALRRAEQDLQARMDDLERRALEIQRGLDAERGARERSELLLEGMREGHRRIELLVGEMKGIVARVSAALAAEERARPARQPVEERTRAAREPAEDLTEEARGAEMADALAAAVERLRARAESVEGARVVHRSAAPPQRPPHKHSMSWLAPPRIKRKQRRERRGQ